MRRLVLLALAALPWTVLVVPGGVDLVFPWGVVNTDPLHVTTVTDYVFVFTAGLPRRLLAWPVAALVYAGAVTNSLAGRFEDRRVTGGLLVLAGVSQLWFTFGMARRGLTVFPVGTVALWTAAWWFHWPDLRAIVAPRRE